MADEFKHRGPSPGWWTTRKKVAGAISGFLVLGATLAQFTGYDLRWVIDQFNPPASAPAAGIGKPEKSPQPETDPADWGWGPERPVASMAQGGVGFPAFNCIIDNPADNDERTFFRVRDQAASRADAWTKRIEVRDGHTYKLRAFVNNCGPDKDKGARSSWIQGAKLKVFLQSESTRSQGSVAYLEADNAAKVWDSVSMWNDYPFRMSYIPGSARLFSNAHPAPVGLSLSTDVLTSNGVALGYEKMDGDIPPGYRYSMYVDMRFRVDVD